MHSSFHAAVDCGDPEDESFFLFNTEINVTVTSTKYEGTATYMCLEEGFEIVGSAVRRCGPDGNWTGMTPPNCTSELEQHHFKMNYYIILVVNYKHSLHPSQL